MLFVYISLSDIKRQILVQHNNKRKCAIRLENKENETLTPFSGSSKSSDSVESESVKSGITPSSLHIHEPQEKYLVEDGDEDDDEENTVAVLAPVEPNLVETRSNKRRKV